MNNIFPVLPLRAHEKREEGAVLALSGGEGSSILNLICDTHFFPYVWQKTAKIVGFLDEKCQIFLILSSFSSMGALELAKSSVFKNVFFVFFQLSFF